jgi:hypothetical protein
MIIVLILLTTLVYSVEIICSGICCDFTGDDAVDEEDFLRVLASIGNVNDCATCGFIVHDNIWDKYDLFQFTLLYELNTLNACPIPLTGGEAAGGPYDSNGISISAGTLLVAGKRGTSDALTKLKDRLYVLNDQGQYVNTAEPLYNYANSNLVQDANGEVYQVNLGNGLMRLSDGKSVVPPGILYVTSEPRYNVDAKVCIGLHKEGDGDWWGRAVLDATFDSQGYVYVIPVVVEPNDPNKKVYTAAAKLQLSSNGTPPYNVVQLYYDPNADDPNEPGLREIEVDGEKNVYVINASGPSSGNILWVYDTNGTIKNYLKLVDPNKNINIPTPIGMHVSNTTKMLYLASANNNPEASSTMVYGLSTDTLSLNRSITINSMGHVTDITEDPTSGKLWVVGFKMEDIPEYPNPYDELPFYYPYLAQVQCDSNSVQADSLSGANDLALPFSILWSVNGAFQEKCGGADLDDSNNVDFTDFAILAHYWLNYDCPTKNDCNGADFEPDGDVDMADLDIFTECWLRQAFWTEPMGMMMGSDMNEVTAFAEDLYTAPLPDQPQPELQSQPPEPQPQLTEEDIQQLVAELEQIWLTDEDLRSVMTEAEWLEFIESIREIPIEAE